MKLMIILMASSALILGFCEKKTEVSDNENATQSEQSNNKNAAKKEKLKPKKSTGGGGLKFHPLKQFCVEYAHSGSMMNGTSKMCSRKYGRETFTISNFEIGIAGITQSQNQHAITIEDKIYNIDRVKMTGMVAENPNYDLMKGSQGQDLAQSFFQIMDYTDTGEIKTIAGTKCNVFISPSVGTACLTPDAVMLEQNFMGMGQVATSFTKSNGGDNADYMLYKKMTISEAPNLEDIMGKMGQN